jgi:hypothetical protein
MIAFGTLMAFTAQFIPVIRADGVEVKVFSERA